MAEFLHSLTPEFFDTLVIVVILIGLAFAAVRLYQDFTRPLPGDDKSRGEGRQKSAHRD